MAMTREEEKELRLNCSIGMLLGNLSSRPDLKIDPANEESKEDDESGGGVKRSAEEQGGMNKKSKDEETNRALEFFAEETPDYDDDDPDWVIEEKKYLIEEYGKKTVTVSFDERDRFIYTCEICSVDCNQRKMLEAHCLGMKHLRKKNLLDRKLQGKDVPDTFKLTKSTSVKLSKPSSTQKPPEKNPEEAKKKWAQQSNYYNNYGRGNSPGFYNQPPPFGPPPGFPGPPPHGPPPNYYGQWGPNGPNFTNPPPVVDNTNKTPGTSKDSLAGGDTGSLLQKLADCAVKNEKDSELAINVVIALMKSLKDFNHKRGETKFIEVLTEADVTFRVLKTLKPTNKEMGNASSPAPVAEPLHEAKSTGVSDFVQGNPPQSNYPDNSQYYGNDSEYPSPVPTGVPPPANYNSRGANGYNQDGSGQNYNQSQSYSNQGPSSNNQANNSYSAPNYPNQGYGNQGPPGYYNQGQQNSQNSGGYPYEGGSYTQGPGGPQNSQTNEEFDSNEGAQKSTGDGNKSGNAVPPPPPPPPPPATTTTTDSSTPDFSNYGYAAGYSMGYYNVPPPAFNQPY